MKSPARNFPFKIIDEGPRFRIVGDQHVQMRFKERFRFVSKSKEAKQVCLKLSMLTKDISTLRQKIHKLPGVIPPPSKIQDNEKLMHIIEDLRNSVNRTFESATTATRYLQKKLEKDSVLTWTNVNWEIHGPNHTWHDHPLPVSVLRPNGTEEEIDLVEFSERQYPPTPDKEHRNFTTYTPIAP